MKKLLILISVFAVACSSKAPGAGEAHGDAKQENHETEKNVLNKGAKWKADETTKKNVNSLISTINRTKPSDESARAMLPGELQLRVDTLVKECRMKGADHDALHLWLEQVLNDIKELKEDDDFPESYAGLKKSVESFYSYFE